MKVFAPYNFVPLNEKVWFPKWEDQVSLDTPFKEGLRGVIYFTLKNETPLFVAGEKKDVVLEFTRGRKGEFIIPGSTIRGAIRNVHEILSFAKIKTNLDRKLSVRDIYLKEYTEVVSRATIEDRVKYAWMRKLKGTYQLCYVNAVKVPIRQKANVITGSAKRSAIKHYFSFAEPKGPWENISPELLERFKGAHLYVDGSLFENYESSIAEIEKGCVVPVFVLTYKGCKYLGVCKYMRIPYRRSIKEVLPDVHVKEDLDLTELIFGCLNKNSNEIVSLKSRVYFSPMQIDGTPNFLGITETVLAGPKPSYYPTYIDQTKRKDRGQPLYSYDKGEIKGFKRYPVHKTFYLDRKNHLIPKSGRASRNEEIKTKFRPLSEGHVFKGKVVFHNLLPVELGSLLSALSFHGDKEKFHVLGMAKPLGYGKCRFTIDCESSFFMRNRNREKIESLSADAISKWLNVFETELKNNVGREEVDSRWTELFVMASSHDVLPKNKTYMSLSEHKVAKRNKEFLEAYSNLIK